MQKKKQAMNGAPQLMRTVAARKEAGLVQARCIRRVHQSQEERSEGCGSTMFGFSEPSTAVNRSKGPGRCQHRRLCSRRVPRRPRASAQSNQMHITVRAHRRKACFGRAGAKLAIYSETGAGRMPEHATASRTQGLKKADGRCAWRFLRNQNAGDDSLQN